jgi:hypothetical protein
MMVRFDHIVKDLPKRARSMPLDKKIDTDSPKITDHKKIVLFLEILGCIGWLGITTRCDMTFAHSRIGQHTATPNESAWQACLDCLHYLRDNADWCLSMTKHAEDVDVSDLIANAESSGDNPQHGWQFFADSDHAGNDEVQNKRRSQNGYCASVDGGMVFWASKVTGIGFATPLIGESHADVSSGAAEVYCTGNATMAILGMSYGIEEAGIEFPYPFILQLDNTAAIAFAKGTAKKTNLKHIDCRQEWCQVVKNKKIVQPLYVPSKENWADFFTKILTVEIFLYLRSKMMIRKAMPRASNG